MALLDFPDHLLNLIVEKLDWTTLRTTRTTCRSLCALCEHHHECGMQERATKKHDWELDHELKLACKTNADKVAKIIITTIQSRLQKVDSFPCILNQLLWDTVHRRGEVTIVDVLVIGLGTKELMRKRDFITSLLHMAAAKGLDAIFARLVDAGMDENALDIYGQTPADVVQKLQKLQKLQKVVRVS